MKVTVEFNVDGWCARNVVANHLHDIESRLRDLHAVVRERNENLTLVDGHLVVEYTTFETGRSERRAAIITLEDQR